MKLLYILSEYLPDSGGGIITHYSRILPGLVQRGHTVKVVLASRDKLDRPPYEIDGVAVEPLKSAFWEQYADRFSRWAGLDIFQFMLPAAWAAWAQAQENFDCDVVEATDWAMLFAPWVASERKAPVVVSLHGSCGQVDWHVNPTSRSLDGDLVRVTEATAMRSADVLHANSRANAEFWREKVGREITVIPPAHGIDPSGDGISSASGPTNHGLVVGRLQNWKGAEVLCKALRLAPEIKVEWVGGDTKWEGSNVMASKHLAENYPDVFGHNLLWTGNLDRLAVRRKMNGATFLVVPSLWDVFNLTVAEGMEAGLPVICSRAAGAEMLVENGRNGFLFDPADAGELAGQLRETAALDPQNRAVIGKRARQSVSEMLAPDKIIGMLEASYREASRHRSSGAPDPWCRALLSPGVRQPKPRKPGYFRRIVKKIGRTLSDV